ncbi:MAG: cation:dicarboxylate symporter family transporter, partial [Planctomycetota bacterium]
MHTKIALAMLLGVAVGWGLQNFAEATYTTTTVVKGGLEAQLEVLDADSPRAQWLTPFVMAADIFMRLLKMLIVPLVLSSIVT